MTQPQPPLDELGEAHEALTSAVANYGPRILENPQILGNVVTDLLPDLPREQNLLIAAAEAGVAADLRQHIRIQNLDPGTAVQLVARMLADKKAIDAAASIWVTIEYARAMGYPVPAYVPPQSPASAPPQSPAYVPPQSPVSAPPGAVYAPPGATSAPPSGPASAPPSGPASAPSFVSPSAPPYGSATPSIPPYGGGGYGHTGAPWSAPSGPTMPGGPPTQGGENRHNRTMMVLAVAVAGALVIYVIAAAATHLFPFTTHTAPKAAPGPTHTASHKPTLSPSPTASPSPTLAAGVAPLTQLLPGDLGGTATQCVKIKPPYHWKMPGLVQALGCADPSLPGGIVEAFQMDNSADFLTTWQSFDSWWGFNPTTAQNTCPPPGSTGEGTYPFQNSYFPTTDNQVVQCEWVGQKGDTPAYAWAYPTENAFFLAAGAEGSSFAALDNWWKNDAPPAASPSPSTSPTASPTAP